MHKKNKQALASEKRLFPTPLPPFYASKKRITSFGVMFGILFAYINGVAKSSTSYHQRNQKEEYMAEQVQNRFGKIRTVEEAMTYVKDGITIM
ncbi:MAG: hypothetical protein LBT52_01165, partial [Clostridiales Family XIII bacterium]|nr:hypothetical protein [Clostridiales Family XIII bacterium]